MSSHEPAASLENGYYWVGSEAVDYGLQCNPYLLVDKNIAVLFDPGSMLDVDEVVAKTSSIVSLDSVKYVVLHHQDPDLAAAVPRMEALGMKFTVVTHWRTWSLARYYGIKSPTYLVNEHGDTLELPGGRVLSFIKTPYLHFSGSIVTWDRRAGYLLSSDLFSAFAQSWSLYAGTDYLERMKTYHENYMPSNELLKPMMDVFSGLPIKKILPQHGSVIDSNPQAYISALRTLECGGYSVSYPKRRRLSERRDYRGAIESLFARYEALFGVEALQELAAAAGFSYNPATKHSDGLAQAGGELWNFVNEKIFLQRGNSALVVLEAFVSKLCAEFNVPKPDIYASAATSDQRTATELNLEIAKLKEENTALLQSIDSAKETLLRDAATGLYNEAFFKNYIEEEASLLLENEGVEDDVLAIIGLDEGITQIEYRYGPSEVEATLKNVARIILDAKRQNNVAFRLHGATFALWMPHILFHEAVELCDSIRMKVEDSQSFIEPITVSVGVTAVVEIKDSFVDSVKAGAVMTDIGIRRLRLARRRGGNTICASSETEKDARGKARILVVDDDSVNANVVRAFLENADYTVATAADGAEALRKISEEGFDLVISELMIPKIDGLMLKESLSQRSGTKDIPFVLFSHLKDEASVIAAYKAGVKYYLKKPYILAELLGIVQNLLLAAGNR